LTQKKIIVSKNVKIYAYVLRGAHILTVAMWSILIYLLSYVFNTSFFILLMVPCTALTYLTKKLLDNPSFPTEFFRILYHHALFFYCILMPLMLFPLSNVITLIIVALLPYVWDKFFVAIGMPI